MTAHTFDSLAVARKLDDSGLNHVQAEAIAEELRARPPVPNAATFSPAGSSTARCPSRARRSWRSSPACGSEPPRTFQRRQCLNDVGRQASRTPVIVSAPNAARCPKIRSARPCGNTPRRQSALNGRAGRQRTGSDRDQCPAFSTVSVSTSVHGRFRHIAFQGSVTVRHLLAGSVRSTKIDADEANGL